MPADTSIPSSTRARPRFLRAATDVEHRTDGTLILRSPEPLKPHARCMGEYIERWGREKPETTFLAQRAGDGWRSISWGETLRRVRAIASALLKRRLSQSKPIAILSDNSIEHELLTLGAMHAGIPVVPISPAYSLMSKDFNRLRQAIALTDPGMVFADDIEKFAPALEAIASRDIEFVGMYEAQAGSQEITSFDSLMLTEETEAVDRAFAVLGPDTVAKFLLTSGSTGDPKAVINTQRMLCSNQQALAQAWPFLDDEAPVLLDWLPWNHTFGGNLTSGIAIAHGGTFNIDEGKPAPNLFERTLRNLHEVSPTIYFNVPRAIDMLVPALEQDEELRRRFFSRLKLIMYAAAALPRELWQRLKRLSDAESGGRTQLVSGWGMTETSPLVTVVHYQADHAGAIGSPAPGCELKMVPGRDEGVYELRARGPNVTPGFWNRDDLTRDAFDEEGFYPTGDCGKFIRSDNPALGIEFAGRIAEEFKLTSGTWVRAGALRVKALSALAPIAQDIVVAGHDRDHVGFLVFPNLAGCRSLCPEIGDDTSIDTLLSDPRICSRLADGLAQLKVEGSGSSTYAKRAVFLKEPPSIDAGEITDKGYINQRTVLRRRADYVERLYATNRPSDIFALE